MSYGINKVELIGNVGKNPELKKTSTDKSVCTFTVATKEYGGKDKPEHTEWHTVTIWDRQAEYVGNNIKVGDTVRVEGKIRQEKYEKDGVTKYSVKIMANDVMLLRSKNFVARGEDSDVDGQAGASTTTSTAARATTKAAASYESDDKPF